MHRLSHKRLLIKAPLLIGLLFLLPSCAGSSVKPETVKPLACPLEATAPRRVEPRLPDGAGIVQPSTEAERNATGAFLTWLADWADWAHEGEARGKAVATWCEKR